MDDDSSAVESFMAVPVLPLRDVVVYPHMVIPLFVGRQKSILSLDAAMKSGKQVLLVTQKQPMKDKPEEDDLYSVGTLSSILQLLKLPDGTVKVLAEGMERGRVVNYIQSDPYFLADVSPLEITDFKEKEAEVLFRSLLSQFEQYVRLNKKIPPEILHSLSGIKEPVRLIDTIAAHMLLKLPEKQRVLEISDLRGRVEHLMTMMESEIELLMVEKKIRKQVKRKMEKDQRAYYLNEQMKAIQKELGEDSGTELEVLKSQIEKAGMSKEAKQKTMQELNKLRLASPMSAEATVCRTYIDVQLSLPWNKKSQCKVSLPKAEKMLSQDHYGLEKVKERIVEYLAVQKRVKKVRSQVLCLVGPPGVGKTSLGQSMASATGRKFARISLGGVRDEAEIRGHRKTYIGAMPGKILQKLAKVNVKNPLFLLDEIDKMAMDHRGDPASALLEVLDPEQNMAFNDHYLEVDYDLSDVMFVATANTLDIPLPLLDRMEIIRIAGYTEDEKLNIALQHLVPKQLKLNGLKPSELKISEDSLLEMIRYYTREAGVRNLEREIAKLCRKVVKSLLTDNNVSTYFIGKDDVEQYLGVRRFRFGQAEEEDRVGQVTGLAWTEVGGEILTIEATKMPGSGKVTCTGKLGDVMQESIQAAMTVVRARAVSLGIATDFYEKNDFHVHVPEGATPKDGPSAGIGMCTAIISALTDIPVRKDFAMTGEITLRGQILPIGGLKEKLLAAKRGGIFHVIIPHENSRDLKEIPKNIIDDLTIHTVNWIDEVIQLSLLSLPVSKSMTTSDPLIPKNIDNAQEDESESHLPHH